MEDKKEQIDTFFRESYFFNKRKLKNFYIEDIKIELKTYEFDNGEASHYEDYINLEITLLHNKSNIGIVINTEFWEFVKEEIKNLDKKEEKEEYDCHFLEAKAFDFFYNKFYCLGIKKINPIIINYYYKKIKKIISDYIEMSSRYRGYKKTRKIGLFYYKRGFEGKMYKRFKIFENENCKTEYKGDLKYFNKLKEEYEKYII